MVATSADAAVLLFDVTDIFSNEAAGNPLNEAFNVNIGANSHVVGIGWDVVIFADDPSWLSEMVVRFGSYSSGGIVDLVGLGFDFNVDADGFLRLEFYESFNDFTNDWDGFWEEGIISVEYLPEMGVVPEPATWAMMIAGFGMVGFAARRRRSGFAQA